MHNSPILYNQLHPNPMPSKITSKILITLTVLTLFALAHKLIQDPLDPLIKKAYSDRSQLPTLIQALMKQHIFTIAWWEDRNSNKIEFQYFLKDGRNFIAIFSNEAHWKNEIGTYDFGKWNRISINTNFFADILSDDALVILNPGSETPIEIQASELKQYIDVSQLPK